jgi:uncharacterized protein YbbC (DUF1343 family)
MEQVTVGLERVVSGQITCLRGKRVGLIANPTAVLRDRRGRFHHAADLLAGLDQVELVALFGPEHGLRGDAQDMIAVENARDGRTGVLVYSLYGHDEASLRPRAEWLERLDALVFDVQDIGSRYYTYVWTMVLAMRACAAAGIEMVVLDRPNPLGGLAVEGGAIEPACRSFVGLCSVPNRHGLTAGEIAGMVRQTEQIDVALTVVPVLNWRRDRLGDATGLPWVMPSPNMPTLDTALVYPGMCLVEGTELSEGRGTTRPFEIAGAPFVDGHALAECLEAEGLPGVSFRPLGFLPTFQKHRGVSCGGVQLHVLDRNEFRPYLTGVAFLWAVHRLWPEQFAWRTRAYEFVDQHPAIDLLAGSSALRRGIERGDSLDALRATWEPEERVFRDGYKRFWLYPGD